MGRDKAAMEREGRTLLERCADALRPISTTIFVITDTASRSVPPDCRVAVDLYPGAGPVGGIITALEALGEGRHIVVACDMPFLRTALLRLLIDAATDDCDAVVPSIDGRIEPLCAVYRHTCIPPFKKFLERGGRAAHQALQTVRVIRVEESELRRVDPDLISFVNVNTPDDANRWLS